MISDTRAQEIASFWHGGGGSALYALASTGAITTACAHEIADDLRWVRDRISPTHYTNPEHVAGERDLAHLLAYVQASGPRGPVAGWYQNVICA